MKRFWQSSAVRLALRYALVQVLLLALALALLLGLTFNYVHKEIAQGLRQDMESLRPLPPELLLARVKALSTHAPGKQHGRDYTLWLADGTQIGTPLREWPRAVQANGQVQQSMLPFVDTEDDRDSDAVLPLIASELADGSRLLIAQQAGGLEDMRDMLPWAAAGLLLLAALLSLGLGLALGQRWSARVEAIRRTSAEIMRGDLSARVPQSGQGDEFDALAAQLNAMLARIEDAVRGMREVSDHVAHDLRKPLARLHSRLELALNAPHDAAQAQQAMQQSLADTEEMMQAFEAMLAIARLDAGSEVLELQNIDLSPALHELVALYADEANDTERAFSVNIQTPLPVRASWALLARAVANVLDNAMLHTAPEVALAVRAFAENKQAVIEIIDHGAGIPQQQQSRMVQRFTRGEHARTKPGSGLGLALARAVFEAHQGQLELCDTAGGGLTVRMRLPLA